MTDTTTFATYEERLAALDAADSGELINNSSTEHAVPLIARLFARGRRQIDVFTGSLEPEIYSKDPVVEALGVFLLGREGTKLRVVVQGSPGEVPDAKLLGAGGLFAVLRKRFGPEILSRVSLRRGTDKAREISSHFLIVDNEGFRLEPDSTKHEAVASFNRPEYAKQLRMPFDKLFDSSEAIELRFDEELAAV
jgi:hypothetical protein